MDLNRIVVELDAEISRLHQARKLLAGTPVADSKGGHRTGGPRKGRKRRMMSAAARAKISSAQKKRWAKKKDGEEVTNLLPIGLNAYSIRKFPLHTTAQKMCCSQNDVLRNYGSTEIELAQNPTFREVRREIASSHRGH